MAFPNMIDVYVELIRKNRKTIDQVPEQIRSQVSEKLQAGSATEAAQEGGDA